jgi:hypothetical protein
MAVSEEEKKGISGGLKKGENEDTHSTGITSTHHNQRKHGTMFSFNCFTNIRSLRFWEPHYLFAINYS